ncbi:MAG TPA: SagB family peptide dehydrogenase [Pseudonocardiaceae bacterium]|nr:SagB family peptide dehydrogenase [Pseudonocardiaceae bacterium]
MDRSGPAGAVLVASDRRVRLDRVAPAAADTAVALVSAECTLSDLVRATGLAPDAVTGAIHRFDRLGLIRHTVADDRKTLLSLDPMSGRPFGLSCRSAQRGGVVLSRFAFSRRHGGRLVLESPLSHYRATLHTPAVAGLLPLLACGDDERPAAIPDAALGSCVELLVHAGLAVSTAEAGAQAPSPGRDIEEKALAGWSFHDLLFHSRSRPGMHDYPIGRTYPMRGKAAPLPAVPAQRGERLPLAGPDAHRSDHADPSFTAVLERRRSVRVHGGEPITVAALAEFLYRSARVRRIIPADPDAGIPYESSVRPYPSGGGAYDLEIYVVANRCTGLDQGVYHYAADAHALDRVGSASRWTEALLADAKRGCALRGEPQVLLVLTARFTRLSWKYSGMAYSMTLKNVGVLYQTMYLVATAMKLAPCALGTGNPALLGRVLNLPFTEESSVGEFLLGVE